MGSVILESADQPPVVFEVSRKAAELSVTWKNMLEDIETGDNDTDAPRIPVPNITGAILQKVVEYCHHYADTPLAGAGPEINEWDKEFCQVEQVTLFEMIVAANFLDIKPLLDLTCRTVANMIKGKKPNEIRELFNIKNDFSPEEEEQVRKENEWCEDR